MNQTTLRTSKEHLAVSLSASRASKVLSSNNLEIVLETFQNYQNHYVRVRKNYKGKIVCDITSGHHEKKNLAVLATLEYANRPIDPQNFTFQKDLNAFVLGLPPFNQLIEYSYVSPNRSGSNLLQLKLKNSGITLKPEESIALLKECIEMGKKEALKIEGESVVAVIGMKNAGKSTLINYLQGSKIASIAHQDGKTDFIPRFVPGQNGIYYCELSIGSNNKDFEFNIAKSVNIKNFLLKTSDLKIIVLINYHALLSDRAKSLNDLIEICVQLFGSKEAFLKSRSSFLVGVTNIPSLVGEDQQSLLHLKNWLEEKDSSLPFDHEIMTCLSERLFIYNPLNKREMQYSGAWTKENIIQQIHELKPIDSASNLFKTVLTAEDVKNLTRLLSSFEEEIDRIVKQSELSDEDFRKLASVQNNFKELEILEHSMVIEMQNTLRVKVAEGFKKLVWNFNLLCASQDLNDFQEAQVLLKKIKGRLTDFDRATKQLVYQFFDEGVILKGKNNQPIQLMQNYTIQETKYHQNMHELIFAANLEAEKLGERLRQNLQEFSNQSAQFSSSLHQFVLKLEEELQTTGLSSFRLAQSYALISFACNTMQVISSTSFQFLHLEKKAAESKRNQFKAVFECALHARLIEINHLKDQLSLFEKQNDYELALCMEIHASKLKEEVQLFDQLLQTKNLQQQKDNTLFEQTVEVFKHNFMEIHEREILLLKKNDVYHKYQQQMTALEIHGFNKSHRIDIEARCEMVKILKPLI